MKANLILFSLFLFASIMTCNVFAFSTSGSGSETSDKYMEKNATMTLTHSTKFQPSQAISYKMREDVPPLNLTDETTASFQSKASYLIHPVRLHRDY
ncbi:hypothetical protein ABSL22_002859 [Escherichia coli]|uniref:hypothetical protein n=1 Tax=Escherichia coli TaxID=562 RepID=UPI0017D80FDB|nr:hypothetical protein [Escherichia coli]EII9936812.1 hypothetical protein [Escherichia coli]EJE3861464.1 hypothetical protein [Escherichia coli]EKE4263503.1 hypothetical protein [Escherichia coli]ELA5609473.1 hypothetical protein [Escherichia coli]